MKDREPTVRSRELGEGLRLAMERAGINGSQAAHHLDINHEAKAVTIFEFGSTVVPGLLQTGDYARAVISCIATVPADEVDARVAARLARQRLLSRDRPPRLRPPESVSRSQLR